MNSGQSAWSLPEEVKKAARRSQCRSGKFCRNQTGRVSGKRAICLCPSPRTLIVLPHHSPQRGGRILPLAPERRLGAGFGCDCTPAAPMNTELCKPAASRRSGFRRGMAAVSSCAPARSAHLESSPECRLLRRAAFTPLQRRQPANQSFLPLPCER